MFTRIIRLLDENITDSKIQKSLPNICRILFVLFLIFSFPINFYSEQKTDLVQEAFAVESYRGYNYMTIYNPDGSVTTTIGLAPYIFDGNSFIYTTPLSQQNLYVSYDGITGSSNFGWSK